MNAIVFSDNVIGEKYNQGNISIWKNLALTIASNIISYIIASMITRLTNYTGVIMMENFNRNEHFYIKGKRVLEIIKIKLIMFYVLIILIEVICFYYINKFCAVYSGSHSNKLYNHHLTDN